MSATLEYELGHADLEAFFAHHASHAPYIVARNRRMRWVWGGVFALLAIAYFAKSRGASLVFLALAIICIVFYGRLNRGTFATTVASTRDPTAHVSASRSSNSRMGASWR